MPSSLPYPYFFIQFHLFPLLQFHLPTNYALGLLYLTFVPSRSSTGLAKRRDLWCAGLPSVIANTLHFSLRLLSHVFNSTPPLCNLASLPPNFPILRYMTCLPDDFALPTCGNNRVGPKTVFIPVNQKHASPIPRTTTPSCSCRPPLDCELERRV